MDEIRRCQTETRQEFLSSIVREACRSFLEAARLLEIDEPEHEAVQDLLRSSLDLSPLFPAYSIICRRYRFELYEPQMELEADFEREVVERWGQFLYWWLLPNLIKEHTFVRNVLRLFRARPAKDLRGVELSIESHLKEMVFAQADDR